MSESGSGLLVLPATTTTTTAGTQQPCLAHSHTQASQTPTFSKAQQTPVKAAKLSGATSAAARSSSSSPKRVPKYPAPLIFPPLNRRQHKNTFIVLHDCGSTAKRFGPALVEQPVTAPTAHSRNSSRSGSDSGSPISGPPSPSAFNISTLQTLMPHTRFIFPSALTNPNKTPISQWFDCPDVSALEKEERLTVDGLQETTAYLHSLIEREAKLAGGTQNVMIGGLSQGCAASLIAMLLWEGEPLRAFVGMAAWLPFRERIEAIAKGLRLDWDEDEAPACDRDSRSASPDHDASDEQTGVRNCVPSQLAISQLRQELGVKASAPSFSPGSLGKTPIFIGHGSEDEKVPVSLGAEASSCLTALGFDVQRQEYQGLGHWYSPAMLSDIVHFLAKIETTKVTNDLTKTKIDEKNSERSKQAEEQSPTTRS